MGRDHRLLKAYKQFRESPPTVGKLMLRLLPVWLLLLVLCAALTALAIVAQFHFVAGIGLGFFIGALARDLGTCLKTAWAWPTINAIVDWNRVDDLLGQVQTGVSSSTRPDRPR